MESFAPLVVTHCVLSAPLRASSQRCGDSPRATPVIAVAMTGSMSLPPLSRRLNSVLYSRVAASITASLCFDSRRARGCCGNGVAFARGARARALDTRYAGGFVGRS